MRRLFAAIFVLLLGFATIPNADAQNRSSALLENLLSVVAADDGRTTTVILDDEAVDDDRRSGRTDRTDSDARRGAGGRGTVEGRRNGDVVRGGEGRGRTQRGRRTGERVGDREPADARRGDGRIVIGDGEGADDVYRGENGRQSKRGNGPAFCRSAAGHPVFGRDWCREKGFGLSNRDYDVRDDGPWDLRRGSRGPDGVQTDGGWLEDILGRRSR